LRLPRARTLLDRLASGGLLLGGAQVRYVLRDLLLARPAGIIAAAQARG
jgi:hypothetical protein